MKKRLFLLIGILLMVTACRSEEKGGSEIIQIFGNKFQSRKNFMLTYDVVTDKQSQQRVYIYDPDKGIGAMDDGGDQVYFFEDGKWRGTLDLPAERPAQEPTGLNGFFKSVNKSIAFKVGFSHMKRSLWNDFYDLALSNLKRDCGPISIEELDHNPYRVTLSADRDLTYVDFSAPYEEFWDALEVTLNVQEGILESAKWFYEGQVVQAWQLVPNPETDPLAYQELLIDRYRDE